MFARHPSLDIALHLALALLLALPPGWAHERHSRSVSMRAYSLVSVGVCGFLLIARHAAWEPGEQADALYGVLTGIGFVGAGAIVKSGERASGMSTAVSLWVAGAIGAGVAYEAALVSVALSLATALALWAHRPSKRERSVAS